MAAHSAALISTEELARRMDAPALRLFDCTTYLRPRPEGGYKVESGRANYDKGHIPGSAFLDLPGELSEPETRVRSAVIYGGRMSLKWTALVPAIMALGYLLLILYFKATGGYKQVHIEGVGKGAKEAA